MITHVSSFFRSLIFPKMYNFVLIVLTSSTPAKNRKIIAVAGNRPQAPRTFDCWVDPPLPEDPPYAVFVVISLSLSLIQKGYGRKSCKRAMLTSAKSCVVKNHRMSSSLLTDSPPNPLSPEVASLTHAV